MTYLILERQRAPEEARRRLEVIDASEPNQTEIASEIASELCN